MDAFERVTEHQRAWACRANMRPSASGYLPRIVDNLFGPLDGATHQALERGGGGEMVDAADAPAKMRSVISSSALAVNVFDYWSGRDPSPVVAAMGLSRRCLAIEFERTCPSGLPGTAPHLDVLLNLEDGRVVGIKSKFTEWLSPSSPGSELFRPSYFQGGVKHWERVGLRAAQTLAESLHRREQQHSYLNAAQLLKHMLGLANTFGTRAELFCLYFDVPGAESANHRAEVESFRGSICDDMPFHAATYQELFAKLESTAGAAHEAYLRYLRSRYFGPAA